MYLILRVKNVFEITNTLEGEKHPPRIQATDLF